MTSSAMRGGTPALTSAARPSPTARMFTARSALFTALSASPAPTGPTCSMRRPKAASTGRARAKVSASAPTITVSVPGLRAVGAAAHRRVGEGHAPLGEPRGDAAGSRPGRRRCSRGRARRDGAREQAIRPVEQRVDIAGSAEDRSGRRSPRQRPRAAWRPRWRHAARRTPGARGRPIPDRERATAGEVGGHRGSDGAEAEEADVHRAGPFDGHNSFISGREIPREPMGGANHSRGPGRLLRGGVPSAAFPSSATSSCSWWAGGGTAAASCRARRTARAASGSTPACRSRRRSGSVPRPPSSRARSSTIATRRAPFARCSTLLSTVAMASLDGRISTSAGTERLVSRLAPARRRAAARRGEARNRSRLQRRASARTG